MAANQEESIKLKRLKVETPEHFNDLNDLIHDEWFDVDQIKFDQKNKKVILPYRRKFHAGPAKTIRNMLIYTIKEKDVIRSELRIHNVIDYKISDPEQLGRYTFNVAEYDSSDSKLVIYGVPNLKIHFIVSDLLIKSEDIKISGKTKISYLFGIIEGDRENWNEP